MNLRTSNLLSAAAAMIAASAAHAQLAVTWYSIDAGGSTTASSGGPYTIAGTIGQPDAGAHAGGAFACQGGFWAAALGQAACYANCDNSTTPPILNVNDFICFQAQFAAGNPAANCDGSTTAPILNVNDFICFQARFAAGCP